MIKDQEKKVVLDGLKEENACLWWLLIRVDILLNAKSGGCKSHGLHKSSLCITLAQSPAIQRLVSAVMILHL